MCRTTALARCTRSVSVEGIRPVLALLLGLAQLGRTIARVSRHPELRALLLLYVLLLVLGAVFYTRFEGWTFLDSLYFCVVTLATVGFGDLAPRTPIGRGFTIIYVMIGTGVFVGVAAEFAVLMVRRTDAPAAGAAGSRQQPPEDPQK